MRFSTARGTIFGFATCLLITLTFPARGQALPDDFVIEPVATGLEKPVAIAFAEDGRLFVAEQRGVVRVFIDGVETPEPFIDLRDEVDSTNLRGMLGLALDPNFLRNRRVYLGYSVVPPGGLDPPLQPTFSRVTRYTGTVASDGNVAAPASRQVLIGEEPGAGIPLCFAHIVDALRFGADGSLLVGAGDGANFDFADSGGANAACFQPPLFGMDQDIGAFRAQSLGSMNGKILRIDPDTGDGRPSNPYFDPDDPASPRSRVWVSGLRNPYRFCVRPGTGSASTPGSIYIGDVGWNSYEEICISTTGGENFGWPCYEGPGPTPQYPNLTPDHSGCDTIGTPDNPGPLTEPIIHWHNSDPMLSDPDPITGATVIGGDFITDGNYPLAYRGAYFFGDWVGGWIRVLRVDENDGYVHSFGFAEGVPATVDLVADPVSGDLHLARYDAGRIDRIRYVGPGVGDLIVDGMVNVFDLLELLSQWDECSGGPPVCPADLTGDGEVNVFDLLALLGHWG